MIDGRTIKMQTNFFIFISCCNAFFALLMIGVGIWIYTELKPLLRSILRNQEIIIGNNVMIDQIEKFYRVERLSEAVTVLKAQMDLTRRAKDDEL